MSLRQFCNFRYFWNFGKFRIFKWPFWQLFFVIFGRVDVFYFLEEFEVDGMHPNESTKNRRKGADGLNCKIFVNSKVIFEIYDKNYPRKKISCLSDYFKIFVIQLVRSLDICLWLIKLCFDTCKLQACSL